MIKRGARHLNSVSAERIRDELVKTITRPQPGQAVALWQELMLLPAVLPEIAALHGVAQSTPPRACSGSYSVRTALAGAHRGDIAGRCAA